MDAPKKQERRKHYVNNKKLLEDIITYKEKCKSTGKTLVIPNSIAIDIMRICDHLSYSYKFINYSYRDELVADGIMNCVQAVENFDPEKSNNPFAYLTMVCFNAFVNRINKEARQNYVKHKNFYNAMNGDLLDEIQPQRNKEGISLIEQTDRIIEQYEEKLRKAREKQHGSTKQTTSNSTGDSGSFFKIV